MIPRLLLVLALLPLAGCSSLWRDHYTPKPPITEAGVPVTSLDFETPAPAYAPASWAVAPKGDVFTAARVRVFYTSDLLLNGTKSVKRHLAELHKAYAARGLCVVGCSDRRDGTSLPSPGFPVAEVSPAIRDAWIKPDARTVSQYPWAYVVRDGRIVWAGHALALRPEVVEAVLAGTYSPADMERERKAERSRLAGLINLRESITDHLYGEEWDEALAKVETYVLSLPERDRVVQNVARRLVISFGGYNRSSQGWFDYSARGYSESRPAELQQSLTAQFDTLNRLIERKDWAHAEAELARLRAQSATTEDARSDLPEFFLGLAEVAIAHGQGGLPAARKLLQGRMDAAVDDVAVIQHSLVTLLALEKNLTKENAPVVIRWTDAAVRLGKPGTQETDQATLWNILAVGVLHEDLSGTQAKLRWLQARTKHDFIKSACAQALEGLSKKAG